MKHSRIIEHLKLTWIATQIIAHMDAKLAEKPTWRKLTWRCMPSATLFLNFVNNVTYDLVGPTLWRNTSDLFTSSSRSSVDMAVAGLVGKRGAEEGTKKPAGLFWLWKLISREMIWELNQVESLAQRTLHCSGRHCKHLYTAGELWRSKIYIRSRIYQHWRSRIYQLLLNIIFRPTVRRFRQNKGCSNLLALF